MTTIGFQNGRVLMTGGRVCSGCCENQCDCPETMAFGGNSRELTFTVAGTDYVLCMTAAIGGTMSREPGAFCHYKANYNLTSSVGQTCFVRVVFEVSNFPDCDCTNTGDLCDYEPISWEVYDGACDVTNVVAGVFC